MKSRIGALVPGSRAHFSSSSSLLIFATFCHSFHLEREMLRDVIRLAFLVCQWKANLAFFSLLFLAFFLAQEQRELFLERTRRDIYSQQQQLSLATAASFIGPLLDTIRLVLQQASRQLLPQAGPHRRATGPQAIGQSEQLDQVRSLSAAGEHQARSQPSRGHQRVHAKSVRQELLELESKWPAQLVFGISGAHRLPLCRSASRSMSLI